VEDHHVDRPDVEARQRVQLTGTNRSFDLIVLIIKERARKRAEARNPEARSQKQSARGSALLASSF
jgi:ribosomal 50S subunit-recycling heat shock protein